MTSRIQVATIRDTLELKASHMRMGLGFRPRRHGGAATPSITITSVSDADYFYPGVTYTITGTSVGVALVELFLGAASLGSTAPVAGNWSLNWTPTVAQANASSQTLAAAEGAVQDVRSINVWAPTLVSSVTRHEWWRADLGLTLSGSSVSDWTGQFNGTVISQGTAAQQPTYGASSFNGRPGLTFDGGDDLFTATAAPQTWFGGEDTPFCIYVSWRFTALASSPRYLVTAGASAAATRYILVGGFHTDSTWYCEKNDGTTSTPASPLGTLNAAAAGVNYHGRYNITAANALTWTVNDVAQTNFNGVAANTGNMTGLDRFSVGILRRGGLAEGRLTGVVGEVMIFSDVPTEHARIRAYQTAVLGF